MTLQLITARMGPRDWCHIQYGGGDTLCNIKAHVHICKIGKRWKQTFPDVHAGRMHTTACHVRTCYYAMSRNNNSRQSVGRQRRKAASITEHSHLSGWCQGPVHVKQTEGIPVRREAVQFFHISILFYFVCLFVWFSLSFFAGCKRRKWNLNKLNFKPLQLIQLGSEQSEPFNSGVPKTRLTSYVMDVSGFQPIRAGGNTHTSSGGWIITQGVKKMLCLELIRNVLSRSM